MIQPEFVDTGLDLHRRVLIYPLYILCNLLVPTLRIFDQFGWAPRNKNSKTDMESAYQNIRQRGSAYQNIQTFIWNLGYLWLTTQTRTFDCYPGRRIDSEPSEPSNSSQSAHTGTNVASFPRTNKWTNMSRKEETGKPSIFADFGREYFHFCSSPVPKTRVLWTRVDLCYKYLPCGRSLACVGKLFKHTKLL
jgi:hypothetical protein